MASVCRISRYKHPFFVKKGDHPWPPFVYKCQSIGTQASARTVTIIVDKIVVAEEDDTIDD
jgi:hypothetical protein